MDPAKIDLSPWYSTDTAQYLASADRRIVIGFRAAVEMVGQPVPSAALRRASVRSSIASIVRDYNADNPVEAIRDNQERLSAGNETSKAQQAARSNGDILNSLDPSDLLKGSDDNAR
ncbi:hypothetical protein [Sphingopyxis sp. MSC1_008]|jgi:hypothetical protein|uniref:hypothetical protein n=1 Tax=Sphingopyxis sp. MSC1_008 TaxID=2909265 RepID=UPI0020BEA0AC|nr:hypothetical protein [Sphingopyxis sp. MSC1_008]